MTTLRIEQESGDVTELVVLGGRKVDQYRNQSRAVIDVVRSDWFEIVNSIDKINDEFYIERNGSDVFGGRLVNSTNGSDSVELEIGSFEEDALNSKPTDPTEQFVTADSNIVTNAIDRVTELSAGTVETVDNDISIIYSNASPAKMIRDVQATSKSFVRYNVDKTVDYIEDPSSGVTTTISPNTQNVQERFEVKEDEREEFTHVRVLGAQQGNARIQVEKETPSYSGGLQSWKIYPDKNITSESRAEKIANQIVTEYENKPRRLVVETTTFGESLDIGDEVRVVSDRDNIDDVLRVTRKEDVFDGRREVLSLELSNRFFLINDREEKRRRDIENFNRSFQGDVVTLTAGGYRDFVDGINNYAFTVNKPSDVVREIKAELNVEGLPYRTNLSIGGLTTEPEDFDTISYTWDNVAWNDGETKSISLPFSDFENDDLIFYIRLGEALSADNVSPGDTWQVDFVTGGFTTFNPGFQMNFTALEPVNSIANTGYNLQATQQVDFSAESIDFEEIYVTNQSGTDLNSIDVKIGFINKKHKHAVVPDINRYPAQTPSGVNVIINDEVIAENIGSGEFNTTIDITGELNQQGVNTIELTSGTRGNIRATAFLDLYRQITQ